MVAAEQDFLPGLSDIFVTKMIRRMARRKNGFEAGDAIAVIERKIRHETGFAADLIGMDRQAGNLHQGGTSPPMVAMGMGEQDTPDRHLACPSQNIAHMLSVIRAWVENGQAVRRLDQIRIGALIGHNARVTGDDAPDSRQDVERDAALRLRFFEKRHAPPSCGAWPRL